MSGKMKDERTEQDRYIEWSNFRAKMIYALDMYDLMSDINHMMSIMPRNRPDELYNALNNTYELLYAEQGRLTKKYGVEFQELLKARDELKEMKKKKKKEGKK